MDKRLLAVLRSGLLALGVGGAAAAGLYLLYVGERSYVATRERQMLEQRERASERLRDAKRLLEGDKPLEALGVLERLVEADLTPAQTRSRLELVGDIYLWLYQNTPSTRERGIYADIASNQYRSAMEVSSDEQKKVILRKSVPLLMGERRWEEALRMIRENTSLLMTPEERWEMAGREAECLRNLGDYDTSLDLLVSVADESRNDADTVWSAAMLAVADILLETMDKPEVFQRYRERSIPGAIPDPPETAAAEAGRLYGSVSESLSAPPSNRAEAKIGLMRYYLAEKSKSAAYKLCNDIIFSEVPTSDRAMALYLLGQLEERLDNPAAAAALYERALRSYSNRHTNTRVAAALYELYLRGRDWDRVLAIAERIFADYQDISLVRKILEDFFTADDNMMDALVASGLREQYLTRIRTMLSNLRNSVRDDWRDISHEVNFIFAKILYFLGDYRQSQLVVVDCLDTPGNPERLLDELLYLDLQCAVAAAESPAVVIARARRYLARFPQGRYYERALDILMDTYFNTAMFEPALDIARRVYLDEVAKTRERDAIRRLDQSRWLNTVAKIGMCYEKVGDYDRANLLMRAFADQLLRQPDAVAIYQSWSDAAYKRGQTHEAMRRLDAVVTRIEDQLATLELSVARCLLNFQVAPEEAYKQAESLLGRLDANQDISNERRNELKRSLYERMLGHAFKEAPRRVDGLINRILAEFPGGRWTEYWVLRSLTPLFGTARLRTLGRKHERTLEGELAAHADSETYGFIKKQLELINNLVAIERAAENLKANRGI